MDIPKIFHFVFGLKPQIEPFHLVYYLCLKSCLEVNRPEKVFLYYYYKPYGKYWDLIKSELNLVKVLLPEFVEKYSYKDKFIAQFKYAHLSDFIRLEKLVEFGGIYADIDTIFVNKLPEEFFKKSFILGSEGKVLCPKTKLWKDSLCNAFIMSRKDSEFGKLWLENIEKSFDGSWSKHSCFLPQELSEIYPEYIHIEPIKSFYKHLWTREGIETLLEGYDPDFTGVYSMHLWNHLWWDKKRKDFSKFHCGLLTEKYIASKDTTYNIIARKYLPNIVNKQPKGLLKNIQNQILAIFKNP